MTSNVRLSTMAKLKAEFHEHLTRPRGVYYAPINVKPEGGGGGVLANHGNLTVSYIPRVGILIGHHAFDLSILYSRREVNTVEKCPLYYIW